MAETSEDRIAAALRTINFEVAAIKAAATERVEKAEAELARLWALIDGHDPDNPDDGPRCRDCADSDGTCESSGLPCDPQKAAEAKARRLQAELARLRKPVGEVKGVVRSLSLIACAPRCEHASECNCTVLDNAADLIQRLAVRVAEGERLVAMWVSWCDGPANPHPYDQLQAAQAYLKARR